jgi:hypothetical protein
MGSLSPRRPDESRLSASVRTQAHVVRTLLDQFLALSDVQGEDAADCVERALLNLQDLAGHYQPVGEQPPIAVTNPGDRALLADILSSAIDDPREEGGERVPRMRTLLAALEGTA